MRIIIALFFLCAPIDFALACRCANDRSQSAAFSNAYVVVLGAVTSKAALYRQDNGAQVDSAISLDPYGYSYNVMPLMWWKRTQHSAIRLQGASEVNSCAQIIEPRKKYLFYLNKPKSDGSFTLDLCNRVIPVEDTAAFRQELHNIQSKTK